MAGAVGGGLADHDRVVAVAGSDQALPGRVDHAAVDGRRGLHLLAALDRVPLWGHPAADVGLVPDAPIADGRQLGALPGHDEAAAVALGHGLHELPVVGGVGIVRVAIALGQLAWGGGPVGGGGGGLEVHLEAVLRGHPVQEVPARPGARGIGVGVRGVELGLLRGARLGREQLPHHRHANPVHAHVPKRLQGGRDGLRARSRSASRRPAGSSPDCGRPSRCREPQGRARP